MKAPKFVEAMINYSGGVSGLVDHDSEVVIDDSMEDVIEAVIREESEKAKVGDVKVTAAALAEAIVKAIRRDPNEHTTVEITCSAEREDDGEVPLIRSAINESIARQLYNALFLPGELVAILRLDDLNALLQENRDRADEVSKCEKCHAFMVVEDALCEACVAAARKSA